MFRVLGIYMYGVQDAKSETVQQKRMSFLVYFFMAIVLINANKAIIYAITADSTINL
jgi:hypothetical protein